MVIYRMMCFIFTGSVTEQLAWLAYTLDNKVRMCFDETCGVCSIDDAELLELAGKAVPHF